jgi:dolichyl-diphosphooligosaccharide--protein glycosyltransferase
MAEDEIQDIVNFAIPFKKAEDTDTRPEQVDAKKSPSKKSLSNKTPVLLNAYETFKYYFLQFYNSIMIRIIRKFFIAYGLFACVKQAPAFYEYSQEMAVNMSNPSIMYQARTQDGQMIMVDDYREAYWWLRDKTPKDARVMAWWDYGYQITGIGERTTIADGNTWNHEVIIKFEAFVL